jgi:hypothetical protein
VWATDVGVGTLLFMLVCITRSPHLDNGMDMNIEQGPRSVHEYWKHDHVSPFHHQQSLVSWSLSTAGAIHRAFHARDC